MPSVTSAKNHRPIARRMSPKMIAGQRFSSRFGGVQAGATGDGPASIRLAGGGGGGGGEDAAPDATIATILAPLNLPEKLVHLVLVNGVYIPPADRATRIFAEGDVLAIWPPIAGG